MRLKMKTITLRAAIWTVGATVFSMTLLGANGCGGNTTGDPTPVQTWKITPAVDATAAASPSVVVGTPVEQPPPTGIGEPIVIVGVSNEFDVEDVSVSAPSGSVTVEFDNRDGGVIHNIHFFKGTDNEGESVAETELDVGPVKQTLTFDVEAGTYFYQCDAHPTTMKGILKVE